LLLYTSLLSNTTNKTRNHGIDHAGNTSRQTIHCSFFWKGNVAPDTAHAEEMQAAHLQFLFGQRNMGKIAIFGPFMDAGDLGGLAIFNATNVDEVKKIMDTEPI